MATITIRNLDDAVHARLKRQAAENHRSLEAEARYRREGSGSPDIDRIGLVERLRHTMIDPGPDYEGSVALIRTVRNEE